MLGVLSTGFKIVGRAFRAFEEVNQQLMEQYTLTDDVFPVSIYSFLHSILVRWHVLTDKGSNVHTARPKHLC